jgi:hypothetical protein
LGVAETQLPRGMISGLLLRGFLGIFASVQTDWMED